MALLCALTWWLVHGAVVARYRQFAELGEPALLRTAGPGGPSQLGASAFLWSEAAFHYRVALMFAVDGYQDPSLLHDDTWQQHPDGVDAWREYALMMEPVYGGLYRLLGRPGGSFMGFLLVLVPLVHALTLLPSYRLARVAGAAPVWAVTGVLAYAVCPLAFSAVLTAFLVKETFSLLLLATFLALHFDAWSRGGVVRIAAAALALALFLASWHLAQFLAALVVAAAALAAAAAPVPASPEARRTAWLLPAAYLAAGLAAGLTPALRARDFGVSLPLVPVWAWALHAQIMRAAPDRLAGRARRVLLLAALVAGGAALAAALAPGGDYGHLYGLFREEIRHHFVKPADPAALPFAVRLFWAAPFTPPPPGRLWLETGTVLLLLVPATIRLAGSLRRRDLAPPRTGIVLTTLALLGAWALSERLGAVFLLMLPAVLGLALQATAEGLTRRIRRPGATRLLVAGAAAVLLLANVPWRLGGLVSRAWALSAGRPVPALGFDRSEAEDRAALYAWIVRNTPGPGSPLPGAPAVFAADIGLSPQLLLYAGRPVVLNSQFENRSIRDRWQGWLQALFSRDERDLVALAARDRVDYVVIDRDLVTATGRWSTRYAAGRMGPPDLRTNAGRMHFAPGDLRGLRPVYDNDRYRVLKVRVRHDEPDPPWLRGHGRWWEAASFRIADDRLARASADRRALDSLDRDLHARRAELDDLAHRRGRILAPLLDLRRRQAAAAAAALAGPPRLPAAAAADSATDLLDTPDPATGVSLARELDAALDGSRPDEPGLLAALAAGVPEPPDLTVAAGACVLAGRFAEAAAAYAGLAHVYAGAGPASAADRERAAAALVEAARWNLAAGRTGPAADAARRALAAAPVDSATGAFLEKVARLAP